MPASSFTFVLVHSPIVGPGTWAPVADELRRRGYAVVVSDLGPNEDGGNSNGSRPFWLRHTRAVVDALRDEPADRSLVLVGHSGAGALLPVIGRAVQWPIAGYVFVDAGIPHDGQTRLDDGPFAEVIHDLYRRGERYPNWTDADLADLIPDATQRQAVLVDLRPPPLAFWEEPIPVFAGWPDAPGAFLRFAPNPAYDASAAEARARGWAYREFQGEHFYAVVDPVAVAAEITELESRLMS